MSKLTDHLQTDPTARELVAWVHATPGEVEPVMHLADHLEESGFPAHAEMIRLHHSSPSEDNSYLNRREPGGNRWVSAGYMPYSHVAIRDLERIGSRREGRPTGRLTVGFPLFAEQGGAPFTNVHKVTFNALIDPVQANYLWKALKEEGASPPG